MDTVWRTPAPLDPMRVVREKTQFHSFALEFDFSPERLALCRSLKEKYGWKRFTFFQGKWRFDDPEIILEFGDGVAMDGEVKRIVEMARLRMEEKIAIEKRALELKEAVDTSFKPKGVKLELYPYQRIGVEFFLNNRGKAILGDGMGCLAGDTEVIVNGGGCARKFTMRQIYERFGKTWTAKQKTRSLGEDGLFKLNEIKKVLYKGERDTVVLKVRTESKEYSIRLTPDHEVRLEGGKWKEAGKLKIGEKVLVNGKDIRFCPICKEPTEFSTYKYSPNVGKCKRCIYNLVRDNRRGEWSYDKDGYQLVFGLRFHPFKENHGSRRKHVLVMEAFENGCTYEDWVEMAKKNTFPKNAKFIDSRIYSVHHKNGIKDDNRLENLEKLTLADHSRKEATEHKFKHFSKTFIPEVASVVLVEKAGKTDVYDLVMDDPDRNFIANGIVVHNCGKTAQALAYIVHSGMKRTLIVCPASVKFAWENEVKKWTKLKAKVLDSKSPKEDFTDPGFQIFIINYDILSKNLDLLASLRWDCVVADEAHMCKSRSAARTKAVKLISRYTPSLIFLSGTPFLNRPEELFTLLNMIDPQTWNNYYDYTARYCGGHKTRWGWEAKGATNMLELKGKISKYFLRRTKEEVLKELPPKIFSTIPVKMEPSVQKEYDLAERETRRYLREMKGKQPYELAKLNFSTERLIQLGILRALTTKGKLKVAKEMVQNIIDGGDKVIVFSVYNEPLAELAKEFPQAVTITGKVAVEDRGELVKKFQEDPACNVFLGGMKSAGVGITLTAATHVLFLDFSWTPADHAQAADRAHRIGTTLPVNIYQLSAQGTIDQLMTEILERKKMMFDVIIEGKETDDDGNLLVDELVKRLAQAEEEDKNDYSDI